MRLELFLEGVHRWTTPHTVALSNIFSFCPNVRIFSTAFMSAQVPLRTRRFLDAMRILFQTVLFPLASRLEALVLIPLYTLNVTSEPMTFPNLRVFVLLDRWTSPGDQDHRVYLGPSLHMPVLRPLHLWHLSPADILPIDAGQLEQVSGTSAMVRDLGLFTGLLEWTVCTWFLHFIDTEGTQLPSTIVAINVRDDHTPLPFNLLTESVMSRRLPSLKNVRFLLPADGIIIYVEPDDFDELRRIGDLFSEACDRYGIRLEVSRGLDQHTSCFYVPTSVDLLLSKYRRSRPR
ncbi:hypothetical protein BD310DRAFT_971672 [Dichomitus squalens]|uniref:F-box domain-containing protein n=1 Tax=Dichomitus squalens TaxID=114155 RepID=A0A4Q9QCT0_9APHY|nr:hypothetical protein BD310DRAFT_971672 [Dichomitus squalens]